MIDTLKDYAEAASTTAVYLGRGTPAGLPYVALGLVCESTELLQTATSTHDVALHAGGPDTFLEELGDVLWYVAACAEELGDELVELGWQAAQISGIDPDPAALVVAAGRFGEHIKKALRAGELAQPPYRPLSVDPARDAAATHQLALVLALISRLAVEHRSSIVDVARGNVAKLQARVNRGTLLGGDRSTETS